MKIKICAFCKKTFEALHGKTETCSIECRKQSIKLWKLQYKERLKHHPRLKRKLTVAQMEATKRYLKKIKETNPFAYKKHKISLQKSHTKTACKKKGMPVSIFYVTELNNKNSYRKATEIWAMGLHGAKKIATNNQCFYDTVLEIGLSIDESGFITEPIVQKINGKWVEHEEQTS